MGVKERKERERRKRSNEILEAARRLFEGKGFLNTTLQDVAERAEVSVGLIYRYFQSKEDIFAALALKGAKEFDKELAQVTRQARQARPRPPVAETLAEIAGRFFAFYSLYGEYFDMLIYSYKGLKEVQIQATTLTRLMGVTLLSLNKLKNFITDSPELQIRDEDEALRVVFMLWGILLGTHKLFDSSGRGHLVAFGQDDFVKQTISVILNGIAKKEAKRDSRTLHAAPTASPAELSIS